MYLQFLFNFFYSIMSRISSKGDFSSTVGSSGQNYKTNLAFSFPFCKPVEPDLKTSQLIPSLNSVCP